MKFLSVCSGIEAASVAWGPLGWQAAAFSEIEPFPSAVLAHHYPQVPNLGDMTKFEEWNLGPIDLLCGGTPCQSFSVAGLRKGLDDPRGNLMLTFGAIADKFRPRWLVWENVPGVLSSNGGRDFGAFLGMLGQLGYGFAYRVLDAQYFGVAQRRRRVFVVGHLGDWRAAAAVLFERHSLQGHPAPSREKGQGIARGVEIGPGGGRFTDVNPTLDTRAKDGPVRNQLAGAVMQPFEIANCLTQRMHKGINSTVDEGQTPVVVPATTHTLRGEGFDASEDGTGRGTPLVPVAFDTTQITSATNRCNPQPGDPCHPLAAGAHAPAIAFHPSQDPISSDDGSTHALGCGSSGGQASVAVAVACLDVAGTMKACKDSGGWSNSADHAAAGYMHPVGMQVRRLTPRECERLQGFPDDYTAIPWRGKPADQCPDGPRYKALGNSWAVPNVRWIGERIAAVDQILQTQQRIAA